MSKKAAVSITWESIIIIILALVVIMVAIFLTFHYARQGGIAIGALRMLG